MQEFKDAAEAEGDAYGGKHNKHVASIVPSDKSFNAVTFLSVVHGSTPFAMLRQGLGTLNDQIQKQSGRREGLVRLHFGLFVQCAEGLDWLKLYRKGGEALHPPIDPPIGL